MTVGISKVGVSLGTDQVRGSPMHLLPKGSTWRSLPPESLISTTHSLYNF